MKKRMLKSSLAFSVLMTFVITGNAMAAVEINQSGTYNYNATTDIQVVLNPANKYEIVINGQDQELNFVSSNNVNHGLKFDNNNSGEITINGRNISFKGKEADHSYGLLLNNANKANVYGTNVTFYGNGTGIHVTNKGILNLGNTNTENITVKTGESRAITLENSSTANFVGKNVVVEGDVRLASSSVINFGTESAKAGTINLNKGITISNGATLNVNSKKFNSKTVTISDAANKPYVNLNADMVNVGYLDVNRGDVKVNAVTLVLGTKGNDSDAIYLKSFDGVTGKADINAENIIINGDINTTERDGGTVNINQSIDNATVVINGDIKTGYDYNNPFTDGQGSNETNNSTVNIRLTGENSELNGNIYDYNVGENAQGTVENAGTSITLDNGASWNMTDSATVTNLVLSNGADLNVNYDKANSTDYRSLTAVNFTGEGGIVKLDIDASTNENNSDRIFINGTHKDTHYITLNNVGANTDGAAGTVLVSVNNEQGEFKANDSEGALYWNRYNLDRLDKANGDNVTDGYNTDWYLKEVEQLDESTTSVDTILGANALNYHTWRAENDQLMRRMGELRNNGADEEGAWFRVHGSKISRDDNTAFENEYTTYELGYDQITKQTDDMTRYTGAALSYTDGSSGYDSGSGENHSKAIAFYNTDIYNSGHYLDLVFKYANMDNDFNVYDTNNNKISGEYKNTGISVSAEYGRKNELKHGWYVEPQAQLTLGYFGGDEYETSNGIKVEQGGIASVLGRVGFNIGKQIGDSGVIYAKANLLHEFAGDYDIDMTDSTGISRSESESFNDTWFEYGVGAALKTGKNNHLYFDFVKTAGGDFEKDWQWNAGMRWTF